MIAETNMLSTISSKKPRPSLRRAAPGLAAAAAGSCCSRSNGEKATSVTMKSIRKLRNSNVNERVKTWPTRKSPCAKVAPAADRDACDVDACDVDACDVDACDVDACDV